MRDKDFLITESIQIYLSDICTEKAGYNLDFSLFPFDFWAFNVIDFLLLGSNSPLKIIMWRDSSKCSNIFLIYTGPKV